MPAVIAPRLREACRSHDGRPIRNVYSPVNSRNKPSIRIAPPTPFSLPARTMNSSRIPPTIHVDFPAFGPGRPAGGYGENWAG